MSKIQIVFSFDTTGSMFPAISQIKASLIDTVQRLLAINNNYIEISIFSHKGYDLRYNDYQTLNTGFTRDQNVLIDFIRNLRGGGGSSNGCACYEYVMKRARTDLNWDQNSTKCLVMIGDDLPFTVVDRDNTMNIDWKQECQLLKNEGIKIYAVKCLNLSPCKTIYQEWANITGGFYLEMHQFNAISDFMIAISMSASNVDHESFRDYSDSLQVQNRLTRNMRNTIATLTNTHTDDTLSISDLRAVEPTRFQVLDVSEEMTIKDFVASNGIEFKTGRGFYQFTKPEEISPTKEIVLIEISSGDMFEGDNAREISGIAAHIKGKKQKPPDSTRFQMFIQSKSTTRKLTVGTRFLYEV
jgi:hypothetical protein